VANHDFPILPSTKVAALLERYPELEDVLIGLAPPFKKLKNPLLRKGVAKVASLKHAAAVGGMPVNDLAGCGKIVLSERFLPSLSHFVGLERLFAWIFRAVGALVVRFRAVRRHYDPDSLRGNSSGHQVSHAHQVVGRTGEGKHPIHFQRAAMPHLA
jgi:hypothetical protein